MQGKNKVLLRYAEAELRKILAKKQSCLLLGPRQVGKTTLIHHILSQVKNKLEYPLQHPSVRLQVEMDPARIIRQAEAESSHPVVFIDEGQKVPEVFDVAQFLIDKKNASFLITGSSARKLKRKNANLLPGRIKKLFLDPLLWGELGLINENTIPGLSCKNINPNTGVTFEETLIYGSLPGILSLEEKDRKDFLKAYAEIYLEEEIRAEALSRKIGAFSRFLELAAVESGTSPNMTKLSNESGVSLPAIKQFYQVLEETLIIERVDPYLKNARKRIFSSPRYYFFDIGVRNAIARVPLQKELLNLEKGKLFEHAVMLEMIRRIRMMKKDYRVYFWRTSGGAEVDCIIETENAVIPIEIKASSSVSTGEIKGLKSFLEEYKSKAREGYVVTMGERKEKLAKNITAIPWFYL